MAWAVALDPLRYCIKEKPRAVAAFALLTIASIETQQHCGCKGRIIWPGHEIVEQGRSRPLLHFI